MNALEYLTCSLCRHVACIDSEALAHSWVMPSSVGISSHGTSAKVSSPMGTDLGGGLSLFCYGCPEVSPENFLKP